MASPGQRRGNCGHIMAAFDGHKKCARCRDKKLGDDPCVKDQTCPICDSFTEQQRTMLSTPQYKIRKDKKSGLLVSPSKVTVVGVVNQEELAEDDDDLDDVPVLVIKKSLRYLIIPRRILSLSVILIHSVTNWRKSSPVSRHYSLAQISSLHPRPQFPLLLLLLRSSPSSIPLSLEPPVR